MYKKILLNFFIIIAFMGLLMGAFSYVLADNVYNRYLEESAFRIINLIESDYQNHLSLEKYLKMKDIRITLVDDTGKVLLDTDGVITANHLERPEIKDAFTKGVGKSARLSSTIHQNLKYISKKVNDHLVIRVSFYLKDIKNIIFEIVLYTVLATLLVGIIGILLSMRFSRNMSKPIENLIVYTSESLNDIDHVTINKAGMLPEMLKLADSFEYMTNELKSKIADIERLEKIRTEFVSNVSHELKTPLTSIKGFVETLKSGQVKDPEKLARFLDIIDIETERLKNLINDILMLSDIEAMEEDGKFVFDVCQTLSEIVNLLSVQIEEKNIAFHLNCEGIKVFADKEKIIQLLINLISNAIYYNNQNGYVFVTVQNIEHLLHIEIEDNGQGIHPEDLPRIFERFYRSDKGRSRKSGGTGLGLSIVKHIVQLYDGTISVESELEKGTKFTIQLPIIYEGEESL